MATLKIADKTYDVEYVTVAYDGSLIIRMRDERRLSEIAPEFENVEHMEYKNDYVGVDTEYNGYTMLASIFRDTFDTGIVQISLKKP